MEAKHILCIGDSNTYGFDPRSFLDCRYPAEVRWTGRLNASGVWAIRNDGQNGRCIPNTEAAIEAAVSQLDGAPSDGVCVMLGTNDLLCGVPAGEAAARMAVLLDALLEKGARILLLAPPCLRAGEWVREQGMIAQSRIYAESLRRLARDKGAAFADAGEWDIPLAFDGVHFTAEGHIRFAEYAGKAFEAAFASGDRLSAKEFPAR